MSGIVYEDLEQRRRMRDHGYTVVTKLGITYNEYYGEPSRYGDPEKALSAHHEPEPEPEGYKAHEDEDEILAMLGCLRPMDRLIWRAHTEGATQVELSEALRISQPSVSDREARIKAWAAHVLPLRKRLRRLPTPLWLTEEEWEIYQRIVWWHQSTSEAARQMGWKQGTTHHCWQQVRKKFIRHGTRDQAALLTQIAGDIWGWAVPKTNVVVADSLVVVRKKPAMPAPPKSGADDVELLIYELDFIDFMYGFSKPPKRKRYGTGDLAEPGLHLKDRWRDIRAVYHRHFVGSVLRAGLDAEEVLQEIYKGFLTREKGRSGFNPERASWGTYSFMVIQSVMRNVLRRERVRRARDLRYEEISTTDIVVDVESPVHIIEAEPEFDQPYYDHLVNELKMAAWKIRGSLGVAYVESCIQGESPLTVPLQGPAKTNLRSALRERFDEIIRL